MVVRERRGVFVDAEAPLVAAGRLERVLGTARARRVAHGGRGRALFGLLVPPDRAAFALRFDFLRMLLEQFAHEFREVGLVHDYRALSGTQGRFSGPI